MRVSSVASEERPAPAPERRPPAQPYAPPSVTLTRGQLVRKDVVTRTSGVRLGNATQLWVDVDEWEVVALDVKPFVRNALLNGVAGGAVDHVLMSSLRQVGDVILVHDESAVERRWSSYGLSTVVGCDVVTERGTYIGRVRDFEFNPDDGMVQRIVVDALGLPIVPEGVVSTYAVDVTEILSTGMDRIILAEGAESRVEQLSASLLQRLQLTAPPWEDDLAAYADYYEADVRAAQQAEWERQQAWARQSQMDSQRMRRDDYYAPAAAPDAADAAGKILSGFAFDGGDPAGTSQPAVRAEGRGRRVRRAPASPETKATTIDGATGRRPRHRGLDGSRRAPARDGDGVRVRGRGIRADAGDERPRGDEPAGGVTTAAAGGCLGESGAAAERERRFELIRQSRTVGTRRHPGRYPAAPGRVSTRTRTCCDSLILSSVVHDS